LERSPVYTIDLTFVGLGIHYLDALAKRHPLGRVGEVKDIVDAVLYLESASFVTGEILHVDGGIAAGLT
jgi:NAD(P)-dependent dehydrogenase (short-subunit alcohol dehydrogenase family)